MAKTLTDEIARIAGRLPDVTTGIACKGTKLEATTYHVGNKAFLFVRAVDGGVELRFKLGASQAEAGKLAGCTIGKGGWAKLVIGGKPPKQLAKWIAESYRKLGGE
jgi:hypothetical protein